MSKHSGTCADRKRLRQKYLHTGGCSSFSVPARSGLAVKLEKMPSFWMPLPKIRFEEIVADAFVLADCAGVDRVAGVLVPELPVRGVGCRVLLPLLDCDIRSEFCLTRRCLSSGSSSESEPSASNASASAGSSTPRFRGAVEDALEWNDGGGELGTG